MVIKRRLQLKQVSVEMNGKQFAPDAKSNKSPSFPSQSQPTTLHTIQRVTDSDVVQTGTHSFRLEDLAFARSGDKGNASNIGEIPQVV